MYPSRCGMIFDWATNFRRHVPYSKRPYLKALLGWFTTLRPQARGPHSYAFHLPTNTVAELKHLKPFKENISRDVLPAASSQHSSKRSNVTSQNQDHPFQLVMLRQVSVSNRPTAEGSD